MNTFIHQHPIFFKVPKSRRMYTFSLVPGVSYINRDCLGVCRKRSTDAKLAYRSRVKQIQTANVPDPPIFASPKCFGLCSNFVGELGTTFADFFGMNLGFVGAFCSTASPCLITTSSVSFSISDFFCGFLLFSLLGFPLEFPLDFLLLKEAEARF